VPQVPQVHQSCVRTDPKALEFYDDFANHNATLLEADGKDILSVKLVLNAEKAEEAEP
jgi:hypothetical protein